MVFKISDVYILFFFSPKKQTNNNKKCSLKTPGDRHHMETFMKSLIDFFLRGKRFCTHFPALFFNSKHYAEPLGIKRHFLPPLSSPRHHRARSFTEHSWTFLFLFALNPQTLLLVLQAHADGDWLSANICFHYSPKFAEASTC